MVVSNIFIFIPTWGNDPIWGAYFPDGLPATTTYGSVNFYVGPVLLWFCLCEKNSGWFQESSIARYDFSFLGLLQMGGLPGPYPNIAAGRIAEFAGIIPETWLLDSAMGLLNPDRVKLTLPERIISGMFGVVCFFWFSTLTVLLFFEVADRAMASPNYSCSESKALGSQVACLGTGPFSDATSSKGSIFMQRPLTRKRWSTPSI